MFDEKIYRRFNHTVAACFVIYFLFPQEIMGLDRIYLVILLWIIILGIEYLRLNKNLNLFGMRDYESDRVAGFVWFASGTFIILGFYEMGAFPQSLAIATIIMAAYTDPVIGEANHKLGDRWGLGIGFICGFTIYYLILISSINGSFLNIGVLLYSVLGSLIAHPSSSNFPGAVPDSAPRVTLTISIDGDYEGLPNSFGYAGARADGRMTTGLYAAPGEVVTVTFPDNLVDTGVNVLIGAHTDSLWGKDTISRHPIIYRVWSVSNETIEIGNAWGGPIYIRIPAGSTLGTFDVAIEQAVEAPHYVHGVTNVSDWQDSIRHLPAPWAEIESDYFILSVPSNEIRELDDPDRTMNFWDEALQMEHNLSGFTPWPRVERAVFDIQISAGWMHSGYPFMAHLASVPGVVNGTQMYENGDWGMFHELGHNHQWMPSTLPGTTETTCNLFSVKLMTELVGVDLAEGHSALSSDSRESRTEDYFDGGSDINQWSVWIALETYLQVQEYFGWEPITEALSAYYDMEDPPGDSNAEFNRWVLELSEATNHNLAPFHEAWGFPLTQETKDALLHLPVWVDDPLRGWVYEYNPIFRNLSAENITASSADLEWDVYDNGTNTMISVCWDVTDGGGDRDLWYSCEDVGSSYVGHWSYGIDDLASETTYYFRVVGENNNGDTWSDVASFTTS